MEQGLEAFRKSYNIIVASWFWSLDIECLAGNGSERFVDVRIPVIQFRLCPNESLENIDILCCAGVEIELVRFLSSQTLIHLKTMQHALKDTVMPFAWLRQLFLLERLVFNIIE